MRLLSSFIGGVLCISFGIGVCHAVGYTVFATPTQIEVVRNQGFMVYGAFGNPGSCTVGDQFFVLFTNTQYNQMYATILAAFTTGTQISVYVPECDPNSWYSVPSTTYQTLTEASSD